MKTQTSMKIWKDYKNVYAIGYGDAQNLLWGINPTWFNCGVYGWNCDLYHINIDTLVTTGYRNTRGVHIDWKFLRAYDERAKRIRNRRKWKYETKQRKLDELRDEFFTLLEHGHGL